MVILSKLKIKIVMWFHEMDYPPPPGFYRDAMQDLSCSLGLAPYQYIIITDYSFCNEISTPQNKVAQYCIYIELSVLGIIIHNTYLKYLRGGGGQSIILPFIIKLYNR